MDTNILSPKNLFQKDISYVIPPYQRPYVWDEEYRWAPFWEDIRNTAESYLENLDAVDGDKTKAEGRTVPHFLGAVVLQQEPGATHEVERRFVVDGQQRMTTLQLLIDAVQEVYSDLNLRTAAKRLSKLVVNDDELFEGNDLFKLVPSLRDRAAFRHAMQNGLATDEYQESLVVQAHEYFQAQAKEWVLANEEDIENRAGALESAITTLVQLVVIDLGTTDNPHVIFETLNARGTPLLESDLIKNYVLSQVTHDDQGNIWGSLDEDWWRDEVQQGRMRLPRVEVLTNYWLTMRTASEVAASRLFNAFRRYSDGLDIAAVMADINHVLSEYQTFAQSDGLSANEALFRERIQVMEAGVITPILLLLLSSGRISQEEHSKALRAIESFLVRRMVCRFTTKDYNSLIQALLSTLAERGIDDVGVTVSRFLNEQTADARLWPTNAQVTHSISQLPLYRLLTRARLRLVLEGIERQLRIDQGQGKVEQLTVTPGLSIEHVMPRGWNRANWPLPAATEESMEVEKRKQLIETLGNLTLTTQRLNSSLSNAPWQQADSKAKQPSKRATLRNHSVLFLNKELVQHDSWSEDAIHERNKQLADVFIEVWPGPDSPVWNKQP